MDTLSSWIASHPTDWLAADWALLDILPVAAYVCGRDGRLLKYNRRAVEIWGREPDLNSPAEFYRDFLPHADTPLAEVLRSGKPANDLEVIIEQPSGNRLTVLANIAALRNGEGEIVGVLGCLEDITRLKSAQEMVSERERRFHELLEALPAAIYTTDADGRITFYNQAAADLAGRRPKLGTDEWCVTWRLYRPDGTPLPHDQCPMAVALKENRIVRGAEALAERPDGTRVPFIPYPTPLRDASGALIGAVNMLMDISEQKRAEAELRRLNETLEERVEERTCALMAEVEERRAVEAQLHQLQKTEAVGQLTGGIAHDFNNLLTAIMGNLDLIEDAVEDEEVRRPAAAAMRAAQRGANLTRQLLAFSRKQHLEPKPTSINELVTGMGEMLLRTLGGILRIELALSEGLWPALVDPNQIENAILNLAINARDAMPDGGTLTLETANLRIGQLNRAADLDPGDYVMIAVADTGTGMSNDVKVKAFDPFFTTKDIGKGSGLGLSQVYGIARQSGGGAEIDSVVGRGTTVRIYLPRARSGAQAQRIERHPPPTAPAVRHERVLVVDDDDDVREVVVARLRGLGYKVAAATTGRAALDMLDEEVFDLVVIDFAMPGMNGVEAGRIMRSRRPGLPILFVTGNADAPALGENIAQDSILRKPFVAAELDAKIRILLDRHAASITGNVVKLRSDVG